MAPTPISAWPTCVRASPAKRERVVVVVVVVLTPVVEKWPFLHSLSLSFA